MKRFIIISVAAALLITICGCVAKNEDSSKLSIVTTIFPQYDFARQICGENADISMLLTPGTESHTYDPTPQDIVRIKNADIFIYVGGESETWVDEIIKNIDTSKTTMISLMETASVYKEEFTDGMEINEDEAEAGYDEHVWTSPKNAMRITDEIYRAVCEKDPANSSSYKQNYEEYSRQLSKLDNDYKAVIDKAQRNVLIFADRFPFRYLTEEYGLLYYAAFPGCSEETEPSAKTMAALISKVNEFNVPAVFYIEFSNQKIADTICESTGVKKLLLHSAHNLSKAEFDSGVTYLDIMRQNLENIKEALK